MVKNRRSVFTVGRNRNGRRRKQSVSSMKPQVMSFVDSVQLSEARESFSSSSTELAYLARIRPKMRTNPRIRAYPSLRARRPRPPAPVAPAATRSLARGGSDGAGLRGRGGSGRPRGVKTNINAVLCASVDTRSARNACLARGPGPAAPSAHFFEKCIGLVSREF